MTNEADRPPGPQMNEMGESKAPTPLAEWHAHCPDCMALLKLTVKAKTLELTIKFMEHRI